MPKSKRAHRRPKVHPVASAACSTLHPHAAGLDIGSAEIWAAVPPDHAPESVRPFGTFTPDLNALADWLHACGITTVAMESTGVYWIPVYEILEARGFEVYLVNARHLKNVPGRKTDVLDCQWIQQLHGFGLLSASFRPEAEMCALRAYLRHRSNLIEDRSRQVQHMQKALQQMNVQLPQVLTDITGETGMAILRRIVAGDRDPVALAQLRQPRCKHTTEEIAKALTGNYRPEHVFALNQALALYDFYTTKLKECDAEIERQYQAFKPVVDPEQDPLPPSTKTTSHCKNAPDFDVRTALYRTCGVDLTAVDGLNGASAQEFLSETGTDMSKWRTDKHFCSWLHLAPHNDISGGKVLRSRILKGRNRAGQVLRLAAQSVGRSDSALGAYYRRMQAKFGPERAVVATAHKLACIVYHMLKERQPYRPMPTADYARREKDRELRQLERRAAKLGYTLASKSEATQPA
jgi:transposase